MADLKFLAAEWPTISRRLDEALSLSADNRAMWLEALAESESVKSKLRRLLADADGALDIETADYLSAPPQLTLNLGPDAMPDEHSSGVAHVGLLIGPYRLIHELGVGGMGSVWLAARADGGLKREVALKLPRVSWSQGLAERMQRERDILASLNHPNIAQIYDAGLDAQGRPYLALEYVEGEPIDVYCKQRALGVNERLRLLLQVARAVAHAHARLVVHRDLKPANILVAAEGQVRLLDFGIAKLMRGELTQDTQLTQLAGRALTLDYASPEQIRGDAIGTASDVYSLGVVAYELLAEAKPYQLKRQSAAALEEAIALVDVRLASVATANANSRRLLKGDLDAILNKALKKDVTERYPTVDAFAQDVERHLAHLPVQALPDALGYRARKFIQRNKLALAAATAVSVSLIAGLTVALWQAGVAAAHADRAERVKNFALSIFADADTDSGAHAATTATDLLKAARQRVAAELGGRPDVAVELMTAVGYGLIGQGQTKDAAALLQETVDLSARELGADSSLTAVAQSVYGEVLLSMGRNKEAIDTLRPSAAFARRSGDTHTLSASLRALSAAYLAEGQIDVAIASARESVTALLFASRSGKPPGKREASDAYWSLAYALQFANRPGAADAARRSLAIARELAGQKVTQSILNRRAMLAETLVSEGQLAEGLRELDTLIPATIELLGPGHPDVASTARRVGGTKLDAGDVAGSIVALKRAVEINDSQSGVDTPFNRGMYRFHLARSYAAARQPTQALLVLNEAVTLLNAGVGPESAMTLRATSMRAWQLAEAGRFTEAESEFKTLQSAQWVGPQLGSYQGHMAAFKSLQGHNEAARSLAESSAATMTKIPKKSVQARYWSLLGTMRLEAGDARAALAPLQQAVALFIEAELGVSPDHAQALVALGRAQLLTGDVTAAARALASADRAWQAFDSKNRYAGLAKIYLAQALGTQRDAIAAAEALRSAEAILVTGAFAADRMLLQATRQQLGHVSSK